MSELIVIDAQKDAHEAKDVGEQLARLFPGREVGMYRLATQAGMAAVCVLLPQDGDGICEVDGRMCQLDWHQRDNLLVGVGKGATAAECWTRALAQARKGQVARLGFTVWREPLSSRYAVARRGPRDAEIYRPAGRLTSLATLLSMAI